MVKFGPAGNCDSFYAAGKKNTYEAPVWLKELGLDAYEYQCGQGVRGSEASFKKIGEEARKAGIQLSLHAPYFISLSGTEEEWSGGANLTIVDAEASNAFFANAALTPVFVSK